MPIRSAPLGSPVGTIGDPVTADFNTDLGCWEYRVSAGGIEVDLDLQAFGWGNAAGSPTLGAVVAAVLPDGYVNAQGGDLNPKGWPASPFDGAYQARNRCEAGGDLSPCSPPFDPTCDNGNNGACVFAPNWVMPVCANDVPAVVTSTLAYVWGTAIQVDCNTDDGSVKTLGGLILEVPPNAKGTYVIAVDPDPNDSAMIDGTGTTIQGVVFTPACIRIPTGSCCSNIGPDQVCENDLTELECQLRPPPIFWTEDRTCDDCGCPGDCPLHGPEFCDDLNPCTVEACDLICGHCQYSPSYDEATECCDPANGNIELLEDGDVCTVGTCDPITGEVTQVPDPDCIMYDPDAYPKNRYISFETGVIAVESAFHVRMTASAHFPASVGDLGWVGAPDADGTALVVPNPLYLPSWPATVRVGDCPIVPGSTYEIRATGDGINFDPPIVVETTAPPTPKLWGDIVGDFNGAAWEPPNGILNVGDLQAAILTFQAGASAAPLIWADVHPEVPNRVVNINDVYALILAFKGEPYPFADPADCP